MSEIKNYNIVVEYDDDKGMIRNSFVESPAVVFEKYAFSEEHKLIEFSSVPSEQKFMSVSILADTPIPRFAKDGTEYTVTFTKDVVSKIVNKLFMQGKANEVSYQHNPNEIIDGVYMVESFILNKGRVESPMLQGVPEGSWVTTYWVKDKKKYEMLANDPKFGGYSIEIAAKIEEAFSQSFTELERVELIKVTLFSDELSDDEKYDKIKNLVKY